MRRKAHLVFLTAVMLAALVFAPASAQAQHGRGPHIFIGAAWGYPYGGWGWGPSWGWGAYWGPGPWYGYGYPYYAGSPDNSAEVKLEVAPKDAQVYADGYYVGIVDDFDGTFQRLHLSPGDHELVIYKPGFRTVKQTIRVRPRQDSKIRYKLQPLPAGETAEAPPPPPPQPPPQDERPQRAAPPAEGYGPTPPPSRMPPSRMPPPEQAPPPAGNDARAFGAVVLRVQPAGADILIDGERWQGPEGEERLVVQVAEGPHRVEVRKDGFVTFTTEITVRRGETTPLNVSLPPRGE